MLKHMVLKGFELSDNGELPDEQDGCVPVQGPSSCPPYSDHAQICKNMQKDAKIYKNIYKYAIKNMQRNMQ